MPERTGIDILHWNTQCEEADWRKTGRMEGGKRVDVGRYDAIKYMVERGRDDLRPMLDAHAPTKGATDAESSRSASTAEAGGTARPSRARKPRAAARQRRRAGS